LRRLPAGPTAEQREKSRTIVWGEVRDGAGRVARARLTAPDGYAFTAITALAAANAVLEGKAPPGFQTPARAFGADWVLGFEGVAREDTP
jgi:saccharopine dehydrogenase (NAD+, L-lysine-forming)